MLEIRHPFGKNSAITQKSYDSFYEAQGFAIRDSFYLWFLELMHLQKHERLLDVACGTGRLVQLASQLGYSASGIDFSKAGIFSGAQNDHKSGWSVGDGEKLPIADHSVDCVASIGSLEHYQNPVQGIAEIARILKPQGRAYVLLPNAYGLLGNIKHVYQTGEIFDDRQPLQRYATPVSWQQILKQGGLEVKSTVPWGETNLPRTLRDWVWTTQHPQKIVRLLVSKLIPLNFANQLIFICQPAGTLPENSLSGRAYYPMVPNTWD